MIAPTDPESRAARHVILLDIGNSTIHVGLWSAGEIRADQSIPLADNDAIIEAITEYWAATDVSGAVVACSVNPAALDHIRTHVEAVTRTRLLVVGDSLEAAVEVDISDPSSVGVDRLCSAGGAYSIQQSACVVADFGTAITVDCMNDDGHFIGGAILPGLGLQARSLAEGTAALPQVQIDLPAEALGQNTQDAIQSGVVFGAAGATRELIERYATHLGHWPAVFFTGGDCKLIASATDIAEKVVPDLCLRGIARAYFAPFESHVD
jgi:type III pantothenate kinase